jgi:hypothetical protein
MTAAWWRGREATWDFSDSELRSVHVAVRGVSSIIYTGRILYQWAGR